MAGDFQLIGGLVSGGASREPTIRRQKHDYVHLLLLGARFGLGVHINFLIIR